MGRRRQQLIALGLAGVSAIILIVLIAVLGSGSPRRPARAPRTQGTAPTGSASPPASPPPASTTPPAPPAPAAGAPLPARPAPAGEQFGANVNLLFNGHGPPPATIAAQLQALRATGVTLARSDAFWEASEPSAPVGSRHDYVWSFDDQIATALATAGLRWLPVLDYTAPWDQSIPGQDHSPPRSDADYAAYAEAFAARYGRQGTFWSLHPELPRLAVDTYEIWNEPDNGTFWTPQPNAAAYAELYAGARAAIDTVDPTARVIIGGLTKLPSFLPAMLAAAPHLRGHIDGVGVHPYGTPAVTLARVQTARAALRLLGLASVPLYATEFGWTVHPPGALDYVPEGRRPGYILRTLAALGRGRCGLAAALLYTWYSPGQDPSDSQQWYGISGADGAGTADTAAFTLGVHAAGGGPAPSC
jgi:polysaccharide biosynthesis protein PslG